MPRNLAEVADAINEMMEKALAANEDESCADAIFANLNLEFPDLTVEELRAAVRIADGSSNR